MNRLRIKNFKAFRNDLDVLELNGKSLLLYGENGAGKSSLYEAIRIVFFKEKFDSEIATAATPEEQTQLEKDYWSKFKNNNSRAENFEIVINNRTYQSFDKSNYQVFMISIEHFLMKKNNLSLTELLNEFDFTIDNCSEFCSNNFKEIEGKVNLKLKDFHEDNILITIDNEDDYKIKIEDRKRNIESKNNLSNYFNEAKLNLIILLILFESVIKTQHNGKNKVLILDDFITSLDIANRTFIIKYILKEFKEFQILLFTHNVHFYNLVMYILNDTEENKKWNFANLYEIKHRHKIYFKEPSLTVGQIKQSWDTNPDVNEIGNKIRQKSEVMVYELSKILMIGVVEENKNIFESILENKDLFFKRITTKKVKNISDLVEEIIEILNKSRTSQLKSELVTCIDGYKNSDYDNLKSTFQELKLFKKVILHPMSH